MVKGYILVIGRIQLQRDVSNANAGSREQSRFRKLHCSGGGLGEQDLCGFYKGMVHSAEKENMMLGAMSTTGTAARSLAGKADRASRGGAFAVPQNRLLWPQADHGNLWRVVFLFLCELFFVHRAVLPPSANTIGHNSVE